MKKKGIFWGVALIFAAILMIINSFGTELGFLDKIPVIKIILGVLFLCWVVNELYKKQLPHIFFPLAFLIMLFEREIADLCGIASGELISNWLLLLCALLFTIGTSMIFPKSYEGNCGRKSHKIMVRSTRYIDCSNFTCQEVENNMGSVEVFFENTEHYQGEGTLNLDNNMGSTVIHIPSGWRVVANIDNNMGSIKIAPSQNSSGKVIHLTGDNNMGSVIVDFV